ncbi:MAG: hypothetical protein HXY40_14790 [Chloroflexi bacterium]|nr:hypothetical protein [Chloroflexota bacterium]
MNELVPDNRNKLAFVIGRVFHPYIICLPTMFAVLSDLSAEAALRWGLLVIVMVLTPGMALAAYVQGRGHPLYEREVRTPLYVVGWCSVLACIGALLALGGPHVLVNALVTLAVWAPMQLLINAFVTKVSAHAAIAAGCAMGLWLLGKLDTLALKLLVGGVVLLIMWARVMTRNHTVRQVVLGAAVGALPPLLVFSLLR